jgi:Na+-transporting NADH:ubiquinone oxidoreductase subunit A
MSEHVIRRGLNIPIAGGASGAPESMPLPQTVSVDPREFHGVVPRLLARAGDKVVRGAPLFQAKRRPDVHFLSPVSGTVREVKRGQRRVITDIVVDVDPTSTDAAEFRSWSASELSAISRDDARAQLMAGGLWFSLRQRPLDRMAEPSDSPQAILICGTETGPLMPGPDVLLDPAAKDQVQAGVHVLSALTEGPVFLTTLAGSSHPALTGLSGVQHEVFKGAHPAGDATVQINHCTPPRGDGVVWYVSAWEVARIGRLFLEGKYPADKVYAAVGLGVARPRFVRTVVGAPLADIVGETASGPLRWLRGSVLTGTRVDADTYGGWHTSAVHVLVDEVPRRLFGWMMPALGMYSVHKAFLAGWVGAKDKDLRPGLHGGHRGLVPVGAYRKVVATPDIEAEFLMKALASGDIEESIKLGLLDMSIEEAALCTYVCPSKIEFDVLLRRELDRYEQET